MTFIVFAGFERERLREKLNRTVEEEIYKQNLEAGGDTWREGETIGPMLVKLRLW